MKALPIVLLACAACASSPEADGAPTFERPARIAYAAPRVDLRVWPADAELRAWALTVAPRLKAATGLVLEVDDGSHTDALPLFWSPRGSDEGWLGHMHVGEVADWIAVDPATPMHLREAVVLHEVLHALGAEHVASGEGVLSPELWVREGVSHGGWPLTDADLEQVCVKAQCAWMQAEVGQ